MLTCPHCGTENRSDARFCRKCGTPLHPAPVVSDPTAVSAPLAEASPPGQLVAPELAPEGALSTAAEVTAEEAAPAPAETASDLLEPPVVTAPPEVELPPLPVEVAPAWETPGGENLWPDLDAPTSPLPESASAPIPTAVEAAAPLSGSTAPQAPRPDLAPPAPAPTPVVTTTADAGDTAASQPVTPRMHQPEPPPLAYTPAHVAPAAQPPADEQIKGVQAEEGTTPMPTTPDSAPQPDQAGPLAHHSTPPPADNANPADPIGAPTASAAPPEGADAPAVASTDPVPQLAPPTRPLAEEDVPTTALPAPGDPFPALAVGTLVGNRYQIVHVLQTGPQHQMYQASDQAGYARCWACGSKANLPGETFCTDCGAQLTGRQYRLYETAPDAPLPHLPDELLEGKVPGAAGIYDTIDDTASGRHYLVLEEVSGQPLSAWAAGSATGDAPGEDRILNWLVQAAETLTELHKVGAVGCDFSPERLMVLPDDRLMLLDPPSCVLASPTPTARAGEVKADVQRVAAILEQWHHALTSGSAGVDAPTASLSSADNIPVTPLPAGTDSTPPTLDAILAHGRAGGYPNASAFTSALRDLRDGAAMPTDLQLTSGRATDVGVQRQLNEDSILVLEVAGMEAAGTSPSGVYIVADGMGGHQGGEVASSIAIRTVGGLLQQQVLAGLIGGEDRPPTPAQAATLLRDAIGEANRRIAQLGQERRSDMGTTITMALIVGNHATIANVGDSRTYLWRDGQLTPISQDHSLVARLIAAGQMTAEEGRHFERRNEIYRALGDAHLLPDEIDIFQRRLLPFDALLLCSDGLWEMVRDDDMERIMLHAPDLNSACHQLVAAANKAGGEDNISVIIVQAVTGHEE